MPEKKRITRAIIKERLYRRRFVVPNAVTVGSLFCGFLTIIYASTGRLEKAVVTILLAILLDGLDGRVARRLNATSKFGIEFDSLADLVSFGVGPGLLMYYWCFQQKADEFGVFITFVYVLCTASRLARFNVTEENLTGFEGLPSPAAAGMVVAVVNCSPVVEADISLIVLGTGVMLLLGYLMVCRIPFVSIKQLRVDKVSRRVQLALGALIGFIWYMPRVGFLALLGSYCLSGPFLEFKNRNRLGDGSPGRPAEEPQDLS